MFNNTVYHQFDAKLFSSCAQYYHCMISVNIFHELHFPVIDIIRYFQAEIKEVVDTRVQLEKNKAELKQNPTEFMRFHLQVLGFSRICL